jgi:hypothetical protein
MCGFGGFLISDWMATPLSSRFENAGNPNRWLTRRLEHRLEIDELRESQK